MAIISGCGGVAVVETGWGLMLGFMVEPPMHRKDVGKPLALPKPFPSDFALRESDPAGLLALGSSVQLRLPGEVCPTSGWLLCLAADVPDYSGGTATELHRVP